MDLLFDNSTHIIFGLQFYAVPDEGEFDDSMVMSKSFRYNDCDL